MKSIWRLDDWIVSGLISLAVCVWIIAVFWAIQVTGRTAFNSISPPSDRPSTILAHANELFKRDDFDKALPFYQVYVNLRSEDATATLNMGVCLIHLHNYHDARNLLEKVREMHNADSELHFQALRQLQNALRREGGTQRDADGKIQSAMADEPFREAQTMIDEMLRIAGPAKSENNFVARLANVLLVWEEGRYNEALEQAEKVELDYSVGQYADQKRRIEIDHAAIFLDKAEVEHDIEATRGAEQEFTRLNEEFTRSKEDNAITKTQRVYVETGMLIAAADGLANPAEAAELLKRAPNAQAFATDMNNEDPRTPYAVARIFYQMKALPRATLFMQKAIDLEHERAKNRYTYDPEAFNRYGKYLQQWSAESPQ